MQEPYLSLKFLQILSIFLFSLPFLPRLLFSPLSALVLTILTKLLQFIQFLQGKPALPLSLFKGKRFQKLFQLTNYWFREKKKSLKMRRGRGIDVIFAREKSVSNHFSLFHLPSVLFPVPSNIMLLPHADRSYLVFQEI